MDKISAHILTRLLCYPLQRDEDLRLAPRKVQLPLHSSEIFLHASTIFRHLTDLAGEGLVESVAPATKKTSSRLYYLTQAGLQLVANWQEVPAAPLARSWGADENSLLALLPRLSTLLLVQNVLNSLVSDAHRMLTFPGGEHAQFDWHWRRDWQQVFHARGRMSRYTVDAALVLYRKPPKGREHEPGERYPLFLLADAGLTGATDQLVLEQRLERLLRYRESPERIPHYQQFPPVIVLVPNIQQQERWQRAAQVVSSTLRLDPLRGAIARVCLSEEMPSAWTLPWQRLDAEAPCRLQDVLLPVALEALPAGVLGSAHAGVSPTAAGRSRAVILGHLAERQEHACREQGTTRASLALRSLCLSERQMGLLRLLYTAPLVSTDEIAALRDWQPPSTTRYLYDLAQAGWIEWVERQQAGQGRRRVRRWKLSESGLRLIASQLQVPLAHIAAYSEGERAGERKLIQRGVPLLLRHMQHTAGVYGFLAIIHEAARRAGHQVRSWEVGAWCERRYRDHGSWHNLRPDSAFEYEAGTSIRRAWVEWDLGTMTGADLMNKMQAYAHYVRSREWARELHALPTLLIIVPGKGQEERVRQAAHLCVEAGLQVRLTTATRLADRGPGAAIWLDPARPTAEGTRYAWFTGPGDQEDLPAGDRPTRPSTVGTRG